MSWTATSRKLHNSPDPKTLKGATRQPDTCLCGASVKGVTTFIGVTHGAYWGIGYFGLADRYDQHFLTHWKENWPEVYEWWVNQDSVAIEVETILGKQLAVRSAAPRI